ncbi:MAG: hypothetical protein VW551_02895 [Euryarchaeota archaeon]|jgi:hypothetical protein
MINWLKRLLGIGPSDPVAPAPEPAPAVEKKVSKPKTKKSSAKSTKKKGSGKGCDFDKLTKSQLLKEAKHRGIPANASLKKDEILARLKSAK